jgi:hypothetical protein
MHFLENNWLSDHWFWLVPLGAAALAFIAYLNNRAAMLRRSMVSAGLSLVLALGLSFSEAPSMRAMGNALAPAVQEPSAEVSTPDFMSRVFTFMFDALREKLSD